ncbi:MAG TPA: hypothetical protein PKA82_11825 [Pyrinomonadaceae bacterium]|nr:hypothetical protein [Pyrinomonadaceae bacterium]
MTNKLNLFLVVFLCLASALACSKFTELAKNAANSVEKETKDSPKLPSGGPFTLEGKDWKFYDISGTDIKIELPGEPKDKSPKPEQLPPGYKEIFSAMHISALDDGGFSVAASQLDPTGKRNLKNTLDTSSDTKAKYTGSFTKNGKDYEVGGCCLYKKTDPSRVWAIITIVPNGNADARTAADRALKNVTFSGGTDTCN